MKLELKPIKTRWETRGSREIWINGEHWATARAQGHGVHGTSFTVEYPDDRSTVCKLFEGRRYETELQVRPVGSRFYKGDRETALSRLPALVALAIGDGWIEPPSVRAARAAEFEKIEQAERAHKRLKNEARQRHLRALYTNANEAEREAIRYVWGAAFHELFDVDPTCVLCEMGEEPGHEH